MDEISLTGVISILAAIFAVIVAISGMTIYLIKDRSKARITGFVQARPDLGDDTYEVRVVSGFFHTTRKLMIRYFDDRLGPYVAIPTL